MKAEDIREYYRKVHAGEKDEVIVSTLRHAPNRVVYGAKAVNAQLPKYLRRFTTDWDIYSHTPEETALEIEKLLDRHFGGDYFEVVPAVHRGTFKVFSKVTGTNVADITAPGRTITYYTIDGINYATLDEQVRNIRRAQTEPESRYRWAKDRETLQRIQVHQLSDTDSRLEEEVLGTLAPRTPIKRLRPSSYGG